MSVFRLVSNRPPERFYQGGKQIDAFRGETGVSPREPEDWLGSVTTIFREKELGLTRLDDGTLLRDAVATDPIFWLGESHAKRWGADTRLLVKLLDAGQRLPVHAHPHDDFAAQFIGAAHGKAEAWYILEGGMVYLGLRREVSEAELAYLVARQDTQGLLALLHEVRVEPDTVVWVPPGELHAIGEGVFLLEVQQPEDLSILLEWAGFALDGARDGHLGLGFDVALKAVNRAVRCATELDEFIRPAPRHGMVLPKDADEYFRLERVPVEGSVQIEAGFAVLVFNRGEVSFGGETVRTGSTYLVPAAHGTLMFDGEGEVMIARPPKP